MNVPTPLPGDVVLVHRSTWYDPAGETAQAWPEGHYVERVNCAVVDLVQHDDGGPWITYRTFGERGFGTVGPIRAWECGYGVMVTGWSWPEPADIRAQAARLQGIADRIEGVGHEVEVPARVIEQFLQHLARMKVEYGETHDRLCCEHPEGSDLYWSIQGAATGERIVEVFHHPLRGRYQSLGWWVVGDDWQRRRGRWRDRSRFEQLTGGGACLPG